MEIKYVELAYNDLKPIIDQRDTILLVTATPTETKELHQNIKPLNSFEGIIKIFYKNLTYYIGVFGKYRVAHVQSDMGASSRSGSIMTISEAVDSLKPKIVIMVGIAFGIDPKEQNIGDVLISETIIQYEQKRVGAKTIIARGDQPKCSKILSNRAKNFGSWKYILPTGHEAKVIPASILSGEVLIDNKEYRDDLLKRYPTAKGGEMEGAGLYAACDGKSDWILIKAICDFADGHKSRKKAEKQAIAIKSVVSFCLEMFNSNNIFEAFEIKPISNEINGEISNDVLFEVYEAKNEKFYIKRELDSKINDSLSHYGVWLFGESGSGKSSLVFRNLLFNKKEFIQIDLGGCIGRPIDDYFSLIYFELAEKIGINEQYIRFTSFVESHKAIGTLLKQYYPNKEFYFYIDEIPISSRDEFHEFTNKIYILINSVSQKGIQNVRFVLSSIENPTIHLVGFQRKVIQHIKFIEIELWDKSMIFELIDLIIRYTAIKIDKELRSEIQIASKGSPRFVKKYFRDIIVLRKAEMAELRSLLESTRLEFFY